MSDDEEERDIPVYGDEINAYLRAGGETTKNIGPDGKIIRILQDPLDKFIEKVRAISLALASDNCLDTHNIVDLISNSSKLKNVQYKNATAYILGYIATNRGTNIIEAKQIQFIKERIIDSKILDDDSVTIEDVIRYARLWGQNLN